MQFYLFLTGYKLASPAIFKQVYNYGPEQLIFFVFTLVLTLYTNLLLGLIGGLSIVLATHILLAKLPLNHFFKMIYDSGSHVTQINEEKFELKVKGIANFLSIPKIDKLIKIIPDGVNLNIDLSETKLVGITFMDYIVDYLKAQRKLGGNVVLEGLSSHVFLFYL